jgi:hypothetical protein
MGSTWRRGSFAYNTIPTAEEVLNGDVYPDVFTGLWKNNILENKRTTLTQASISHT